VKTEARAEFYARRFARHPCGPFVGYLLGWLLIDWFKVYIFLLFEILVDIFLNVQVLNALAGFCVYPACA
jgi:hypothetical protein